MAHVLANIRPDGRTADCQECGPDVRIKIRTHENGRRGWRCTSVKPEHTSSARRAAWAPEVRKFRRRQETYGISVEEQMRCLDEQQGRCAICQQEKPLVLDHCHSQGHLRGFLCHRCNSGLGYFGEDPALLSAAIAYLAR